MSPLMVYSTPQCMACRMTSRQLDAAGIEYRVIDVSADDPAREYVQDLGYSAAPVVVVSDDEHWSGFRPDLIACVAKARGCG
nr:glutaredoxin-like protein NrdH [Gulosibacter hominis]